MVPETRDFPEPEDLSTLDCAFFSSPRFKRPRANACLARCSSWSAETSSISRSTRNPAAWPREGDLALLSTGDGWGTGWAYAYRVGEKVSEFPLVFLFHE